MKVTLGGRTNRGLGVVTADCSASLGFSVVRSRNELGVLSEETRDSGKLRRLAGVDGVV